MLIFLLIYLLFLIWYFDQDTYKVNYFKSGGKFDQKFVYLDACFSKGEKQQIIKAFNVWSTSTNGYLKWVFCPWPFVADKTNKHLLVFKLNSKDIFVQEHLNNIENTKQAYAVARPNFQDTGVEEIILIRDRIANKKDIFNVMLHEIWHIVMQELDHWHDQRSISSYHWYKKLKGPTEIDLRALEKNLKVNHNK